MNMRLIAIAIVAENRVIGDGKTQPFSFKEDWKRFKRLTMGCPLIMGRATYDAVGVLPGRTAIVLSRTPETVDCPCDDNGKPRAYAVSDVDEAVSLAQQLSGDGRVFVIGGGQIYRLMWDLVDELDLTEVPQDAEGSVTFPDIDHGWIEIERIPGEQFDFVRYRRADSGV